MPEFQPGIRIGRYDAEVLIVGVLVCVFALHVSPALMWIGFYVLVQFALFCNVFRVPLWLELAWASVFVYAFSSAHFPLDEHEAWRLGSALVVSGVVAIVVAIRLPLYHGIYWEKLNPRLPERWAERQRAGRV